jgi:hypothetical protein
MPQAPAMNSVLLGSDPWLGGAVKQREHRLYEGSHPPCADCLWGGGGRAVEGSPLLYSSASGTPLLDTVRETDIL